jgi:N-acetylmuramoyl-L-alanine amidase
MTGSELIKYSNGLAGSRYVLGALVPKDTPNYKGPFDCAETYGFLYGCDTANIAKAHKADAYTGYFDRDAEKIGQIIPVNEAAKIPGAIILRIPTGSAIGHIVISKGNGKTNEANSTKYGCGEFGLTGRRFDLGILLPGVTYASNADAVSSAPKIVVFRLKVPYMIDPYIGLIQKALGFTSGQIDNTYGPYTQSKVVAFQKAKGLVMDGEVMPGGQTAKALRIK